MVAIDWRIHRHDTEIKNALFSTNIGIRQSVSSFLEQNFIFLTQEIAEG